MNYSAATTASVVDDNGKGSGTGAVAHLTIVAGAITAVSFSPQGTGYVRPRLDFFDPSNLGSGAAATITLDNSATFTASAGAPFASGDLGKVIRLGGGIATVTAFTDSSHVTANITAPIIDLIPNSNSRVRPQTSGNWTMTTPVSTISGLKYLAGATVTGTYDGNVIPAVTVPASGTISLPAPASQVLVGLAFLPQLQSTYLEVGAPTIQGQRKKIAAVTARIELSKGIQCGTNQPDGSTLSPPQLAPAWNNLDDVPDKGIPNYGSVVVPLFTGDSRIVVTGGFTTPGQIALQQPNPFPMNILAIVPEMEAGDSPQTTWPKKQQRGQQQEAGG